MIIVPSPLIADISGSVKNMTFASWKGIRYVRTKNIPGGEPSAAQLVRRQNYSDMSWLWRFTNQEYQDAWNLFASRLALSGFNSWIADGMAVVQQYGKNHMSPYNPEVFPLVNLVASPGGATHEIDIDWTDAPPGADYKLSVFYSDHGAFPYELISHDTIQADSLSHTFTGMRVGYWTHLFISVQNVVTRQLSISDHVAAIAPA